MDQHAPAAPEILEPSLELVEFSKRHALSPREGEILRLLLSRVTTAEAIGQMLGISPHTVNNHLQNLFSKTGTTNKTEVVSSFVRCVLQRLDHCKLFVRQPKVMVLDDEADITHLMDEYLSRRGIKVYSYTDPKAALAAVPELALDFIVSDIDMPGLNGLELLQGIRKLHRWLPAVIFVTGKPAYSVESTLAKGAIAFMEKPLKLERLFFTLIENYVEGKAERSRLLRVDAELPATVNRVHKISTRNIGFGGAFLPFAGDLKRHASKYKLGVVVELTFALAEGAPVIRAEAEVVWRRETGSLGLPAGLGVKFLALDPAGKEALEEYVRVHKITSFIPLGEA